MGLIETIGKRTSNPYRLAAIDREVYSPEELMYSLVQSAQFLDEGILDEKLTEWIRTECGLPELADSLDRILRSAEKGRNRVEQFVMAILGASDYVTPEQRRQTSEILRTGEGMQQFEMRLARADYMVENGHFAQALLEYQRILDALPEPERTMRARAEHSRGLVYAYFFHFDMAAECFQRAYSLKNEDAYYLDYLAAVRMYLPDKDYVAFVARHPEAYAASLKLESAMDEAARDEEDSAGAKQIRRLRAMREQGADDALRTELSATAREMRNNYRINAVKE